MRNNNKIEEIEQLLESYYEGMTSKLDEKRLQKFFRQKYLPEQFAAEKAMFDYFASQQKVKQKKPLLKKRILQWSSVAATVIVVVAIYFQFPRENNLLSNGTYMIKNGIEYNDPELIKKEAFIALESVAMGSEEMQTDEAHSIMMEQLKGFEL